MEIAIGMSHDSLPFKYLGVPICKGKLKQNHCQDILEHFDKHINSWYSKILNPMGRLILIKHVLSSIPLHYLAVHSLPISVMNHLHRVMSNFLWVYSNGKPKHHWKNWESICTPKDEGGLGLRNLKDLHKAYSIKHWWKAQKDNSIWATYI
ncbi:hypothetical protein DM860_018124 [Cuscuta australis]|uniref:Reverse transcriptase zinc-binding domain-containing protein n=1 Tax=Cuscuta australis TaxID=267555 RepID=A0A328DYH9_9ASTE|nr:hypothetical protein DM860_018124 [Cuscuta australis]